MKRLVCILVILGFMSLSVFANPNMSGEVGNISVPNASPMIDGNISASEGWSEGVYAYKDIMATFGNCNEILQSFYLYYAYDAEGIYYAADILDNSFILSTGEDDIDNKKNDFNIKNENVYGYNGDIFTFTVDPLGLFMDAGYYSNEDYNAWYSVGIFEGNVCRMYRGHNRSGDITSEVKLQGHTTDEGWCFETFIPWEFFCQDAEDMSYAEFSPTVEDMAASGAKHRAMAIYMDRYFDPEGEEVATFQRFATCGYVLPDGLLGYLSSGMCLKAYGITLSLESTDGGSDTMETESADTSDSYDDTTEEVAESSADTTSEVTSGTESAETGEEAASTDIVVSDTQSTIVDTAEKESGTKADTADKTSNTKKQESSIKTDDTASSRTTTKTQNTSKPQSTGGGSAQTFDMGVAVAVGGVVIAVIAFVFLKKKR